MRKTIYNILHEYQNNQESQLEGLVSTEIATYGYTHRNG